MFIQKELITEFDPKKNWKVLACQKQIAWVHLSAPKNCDLVDLNYNTKKGYDISRVFEVDLNSDKWTEIELTTLPFVLWDFYVTDSFLYASLLVDANKDGYITDEDYFNGIKIFQVDRNEGKIKDVWTFDSNCSIPFITKIIDDNYILLDLTYKNECGEVYERYDLLDLAQNKLETIYIDNEEMIEARILLTKTLDGKILLLKDLHVTPSDKPVSGGKADKIVLMEYKR